jgi:hypothetical protein
VIIGGWRGPGWRIVDADRSRAREVRDWMRSAITRHHCPVDPDDVALAASELYANAVMHGPAGGRVLAGYCLWSGGARIVVCDGGGPGMPRVRQGAGLAEGGRGLQVIDSLAVAWGSFRLPGARVVWCDFGQRLRAPDSDAWAWLRCVLAAFPLDHHARAARPHDPYWPVPGDRGNVRRLACIRQLRVNARDQPGVGAVRLRAGRRPWLGSGRDC